MNRMLSQLVLCCAAASAAILLVVSRVHVQEKKSEWDKKFEAMQPGERGRAEQERARQLIEGETLKRDTPVISVPTEQPTDKQTEDAIRRLGEQIRQQPTTQERPAESTTPASTTTAPPGAVCGPVVTAKLFATLAKMTRDFNAVPGAKVNACHNLYGLTTSESAWDILGLNPGTSPGFDEDRRRGLPFTGSGPQARWDPEAGVWKRTGDGGRFDAWLTGASKVCAIPRPDDVCAATVQFMGTCQHAQVVNYVMWGRVNKLCGYPLSDARAAVSARSVSGDSEMRQRQLDMTNIGYNANSADEVRRGFLTTPTQFQKCALKCPVTLDSRPWNYHWEGFRDSRVPREEKRAQGGFFGIPARAEFSGLNSQGSVKSEQSGPRLHNFRSKLLLSYPPADVGGLDFYPGFPAPRWCG